MVGFVLFGEVVAVVEGGITGAGLEGFGDEEVPNLPITADTHRDGHHSINTGTIRTPLIPGHVLRTARPGRALLIHGTLPPAQLDSRPWDTDRRLRRLATPQSPSRSR